MKKALFILIQCTWGMLQTLIGLGFFIANRKCSHRMYRGCIDTQWNHTGGLSLGLFIFTPKDSQNNAQLIRVHEYGHCIQSLLLGPLSYGEICPTLPSCGGKKACPILPVLWRPGRAVGANGSPAKRQSGNDAISAAACQISR